MKIAVVGTSGSGKSTLADRLARRLEVPHIELDAFWHRPNWTTVTPAELLEQVSAAVAGDGWVVDGNYTAVSHLIWERADVIVWLDFARPLVMWRVIRRTLGRILVRKRLWHGNRERLGMLLSRDPDDNIVLWAWKTHGSTRERYIEVFADPRWSGKGLVRLRSPRAARAFVTSFDQDRTSQ